MNRARRDLSAGAVYAVWDWAVAHGSIGPDDRRARRYFHLGPGSCIAFPPGAVMGAESISIGAGTLVCPHVSLAVGMPGEPLDPGRAPILRIGARCTIGRGSSIVARRGVTVEDDVTTGPNVYVTDHNHTYDDPEVPIGRQWPAEAEVRVGAGSWLGTGVVVLPGTDIGRNVTVAAGSVVRGRVPDRTVVAGSPAHVVRRHDPVDGWVPPLPPRSITPPDGWVAR